MAKASVRIEGLAEMQRNLKRLADAVQRDVSREAVRAAAEPVREEMARRARRAPRATRPGVGHLADNIITTVRADKDGATSNAGPNRAAFWGKFLEFGTRKMRSFPFARPAWDATRGEALEVMIDKLSEGIVRESK